MQQQQQQQSSLIPLSRVGYMESLHDAWPNKSTIWPNKLKSRLKAMTIEFADLTQTKKCYTWTKNPI